MKTVSLIDGFNFYHSIRETFSDRPDFRWLNLVSLSKSFSRTGDDPQVYYFTAYCTCNSARSDRHKVYVNALMSQGVSVVLGRFKQVERQFLRDKMKIQHSKTQPADYDIEDLAEKIVYKTHEEKETDVNLAVYLYDLAAQNQFDRAILFTADSDLCPAIRMVKMRFPDKQIDVVFVAKHWSQALSNVADSNFTVTRTRLSKHLLPPKIVRPNGDLIVRPPSWTLAEQ